MDCINYCIYEPGQASSDAFGAFLRETDDLIIPPLSLRVNLDEYSKKVINNAILFVAKTDKEWIGVEAVYFNAYPDFSFSTYLCVKKEYQNNSTVGINLMLMQKKYLKEHKTKGLRFAIRKSNSALLNYHLKTGGKIISEHTYPGTEIVEVEMEKIFIKD